ncbi:MAG TPA: thioredoxin fold domain-containing protein, partial [Pyrinomonadaceae bacterium]
ELGVPLIVYFYADWCPYCHDLDTQYLPASPVQQYLKGVAKVRINPEHGRPERELANQYGVTGYPSFFVIRKVSSAPIPVNPFRKVGPNLTPAQFAQACVGGRASFGPASTIASRRTATATGAAAPKTVPDPSITSIDPANAPTISSILDRYVVALGGREAIAKVASRVTNGRIDIPGVSFGGRLETYAKAPNLALTVMTAEPIGVLKRGFDGRTAWSLSDQKGAPQPSQKELAALADDAQLYREINLRQLYPQISLAGSGTVGTRAVYIVQAQSRFGFAEKFYFDVQSGLLLRRDAMRPSSRGPVLAELYFSDWRNVDGIKLPFKITQRMPTTTYVFTLEDVKHNVQLDNGIFRAP